MADDADALLPVLAWLKITIEQNFYLTGFHHMLKFGFSVGEFGFFF